MACAQKFLCKLILVVFCFCLIPFASARAAVHDAGASLAAGKQMYNRKDYDGAMDRFIEVFTSGNSEQIAEANEYVNLIHFAIGGVDVPKRVPTEAELEAQRLAALSAMPTPEEQEKMDEQAKAQAFADAEAAQAAAAAAEAAAALLAEQQKQAQAEITEGSEAGDAIVASDVLATTDPQTLRALRKEAVDTHIAVMTENLIARLNKQEGVFVYMRGGAVDAVDVKSNVIFEAGNKFRPSAKPILDDIYALMLLSGVPSFVLMPEGAYTDEVSINAVKEALALNSYFINQGISSAKISFNTGLTAERAPAKFSSIEGMGIVFDYGERPALKRRLNDKNTPPILSLGVYPFNSITPAKDEGMLADFSVVEASSPVANWELQIVRHGRDGRFYVVRQVKGEGSVYRQVFWNGKKQYFGEILPLGDYTIILRAKDAAGREKTVRRKYTLDSIEEPLTATKGLSAKTPELNYKAARLWQKPGRTEREGAAAAAADLAGQSAPVPEQPADSAPLAPEEAYDPYAPAPLPGAQDPYQYSAPALPSGYASAAPGEYNTPVMPGGYDAMPSGMEPASAAPIAPADFAAPIPLPAYEYADPATGGEYNTVNMPYPSQEPVEGGPSAEDFNY